MPDSWIIIANPASGGGRGRRVGEQAGEALRKRGAMAEIAWTSGSGDAEHLARTAVAQGMRRIAACGGDGTIHEVANGLAGSDAVLGLMPCGRGNDLARALRIPKGVDGAVEALVNGDARRIDLGRMGHRFFCTVACWGFDAQVSRTVRGGSRWPGGGYVLAVLRELWQFQCPKMRLSGDFGTIEGRIFVAAAANTPFYGGGIRIAPDAVMDDGYLDMCLGRELSRIQLLGLFPKAYFGKHLRHPAVQMERTRFLDVASDDPLWIFADGEPMGQAPAWIEIAAGALSVKVPKGHESR